MSVLSPAEPDLGPFLANAAKSHSGQNFSQISGFGRISNYSTTTAYADYLPLKVVQTNLGFSSFNDVTAYHTHRVGRFKSMRLNH